MAAVLLSMNLQQLSLVDPDLFMIMTSRVLFDGGDQLARALLSATIALFAGGAPCLDGA